MVKKLMTFFRINRRFLIAVIALLEVAAIFCAVTFSWIEGVRTGRVDDSSSTVSAGDGLIFTDLNGAMISTLNLNTAKLTECSSVDGRNFFFPTSESKVTAVTNEEGKVTYTDSMVYRAGTDADLKAGKYISVDFNVLSYAATGLYISESSSVSCTNDKLLESVRVSLNFNDGEAPIVFCPALESGKKLETERPISLIDNNGVGTDSSLTVLSLKDYTPITAKKIKNFTYGQSKRVTLSIWLEGTYSKFNSTNITDEDSISVSLTLTSSSENTKKVKFVDYSPTTWVKKPSVSGQDIIMYAVDPANENNRYQLTRTDDKTYIGDIPADLDDVYFMRDDPAIDGDTYNVWSKDDNTIDVMSNSDMDIPTYYAIGRGIGTDTSKPVDKYNYGYWVKSNAQKLFDVYLLDEGNKLDNAAGDKKHPYLYIYNMSNYAFIDTSKDKIFAEWPGLQMERVGYVEDTSHSNVFHLIVPADSESIIFNGGSSANQTKAGAISLSGVSANDQVNKVYYKVWNNNDENGYQVMDLSSLVYIPN